MKNDVIRRLMDEYRRLEESEENRRRRSMWKGLDHCSREQWRATPRSDHSWQDGQVPLTADIQTLTWSKLTTIILMPGCLWKIISES